MSRHIPDDWGRYYSTCSLCGNRYHDSEGGCDCHEDLVCQCKDQSDSNWASVRIKPFPAEVIQCLTCGSEPLEETGSFVTYHKARRDHKDGTISVGDFYRKEVFVGYFPGGRFYRRIEKTKVTEKHYIDRDKIELRRRTAEMNREFAQWRMRSGRY